ncbi:MAG: hypothetical protein MUF87_10330, partial [Anaerolineae bacterium]|nr:hypothetical protein [Anaerolineae bacterium]
MNRTLVLFLFFGLITLIFPAQAQVIPTPVRPFDLNTGDFWTVDFYDNDPVNSPSGDIQIHPTATNSIATFEPDSFRMAPGPGQGGSGCARNGGKVFLGTSTFNTLRLRDLTRLSYSALITNSPNDPNLSIFVNIFVDTNNDGIWRGANDSVIVFEPFYTVGSTVLNTWQNHVIIGPGSNGRWHVNAQSLPGVGHFAPNENDLWTEFIAQPFTNGDPLVSTIGDLRIINPQPGCSPTDSQEGTGSGFAFVLGQKNGAGYFNMIGYIDQVLVETTAQAVIVYDFTLPKAPAQITAVSGTPQSTNINTPFAQPLRVYVSDTAGYPAVNELVTFSAPPTGASVVFPNGNTALTDSSGFAEVLVNANGIGGTYTILANVTPPLGTPAAFTLTNLTITTQTLLNGGFEISGATEREAANWATAGLLPDDRRLCNRPNGSSEGVCAFRFLQLGDSN